MDLPFRTAVKQKLYSSWNKKDDPPIINTERIDHLYFDPLEKKTNFNLHYGDLTDSTNLIRLISEIKPDEIYNLATGESRNG